MRFSIPRLGAWSLPVEHFHHTTPADKGKYIYTWRHLVITTASYPHSHHLPSSSALHQTQNPPASLELQLLEPSTLPSSYQLLLGLASRLPSIGLQSQTLTARWHTSHSINTSRRQPCASRSLLRACRILNTFLVFDALPAAILARRCGCCPVKSAATAAPPAASEDRPQSGRK